MRRPGLRHGEADLAQALYRGGVVHFSLAEPRYGDEAATFAALVAVRGQRGGVLGGGDMETSPSTSTRPTLKRP